MTTFHCLLLLQMMLAQMILKRTRFSIFISQFFEALLHFQILFETFHFIYFRLVYYFVLILFLYYCFLFISFCQCLVLIYFFLVLLMLACLLVVFLLFFYFHYYYFSYCYLHDKSNVQKTKLSTLKICRTMCFAFSLYLSRNPLF